MNLRDKTILTTCAARGLGRELALLLDALGCSLFLTDRDTDCLSAPARELSDTPKIFPFDLGDLCERKNLIQAVKSQTQIEILINCAGVGSHSQSHQLTVDEIERVTLGQHIDAAGTDRRVISA